MKKTNIIVKILLILIVSMLIVPNNIFAKKSDGDKIDEQIEGTITQGFGYRMQKDGTMDTDISIGNNKDAINSSKGFTEKILGYVQAIGSVISVVALLIIGIRYMVSSLEEKAQMKGLIIYYVIGAVLVFATSNLLSVAYKVINGITL